MSEKVHFYFLHCDNIYKIMGGKNGYFEMCPKENGQAYMFFPIKRL